MEDDYIKNRKNNSKEINESNLKDYNDNPSINPEFNKSVIIPNNHHIPTTGSYQKDREGIEIKNKQISNFNNLDAKIKHKKLREGD